MPVYNVSDYSFLYTAYTKILCNIYRTLKEHGNFSSPKMIDKGLKKEENNSPL